MVNVDKNTAHPAVFIQRYIDALPKEEMISTSRNSEGTAKKTGLRQSKDLNQDLNNDRVSLDDS
jgi:hypothetical protein